MPQPTVVLVHGAFAESASWAGVISRLHAKGHTTVAVANPLHSLQGPIVLAGHSYGGAVMSVAASGNSSVSANAATSRDARWRPCGIWEPSTPRPAEH